MREIPHLVGSTDREENVFLWQRLEADGFTGRVYDATVMELCRYALSRLRGVIRNRSIPGMIKQMFGRGLPSSGGVPLTEDDIDDLVQDTVLRAVEPFRDKALAGEGWRPEGNGAGRTQALTSYFFAGCLAQFNNVHRSWLRTARRAAHRASPSALDRVPAVEPEESDHDLLDRVREIVPGCADDLLMIVFLTRANWGTDEIAELLGTSQGSVEGKLYRFQKAAKAAHDRSGGTREQEQ